MQLAANCKIMSYRNGKSEPSFLFTAKVRETLSGKKNLKVVCAKCSAGPESYCLSLYHWRYSSGRLNGGGEASSSSICLLPTCFVGFCVVCVCVVC